MSSHNGEQREQTKALPTPVSVKDARSTALPRSLLMTSLIPPRISGNVSHVPRAARYVYLRASDNEGPETWGFRLYSF